MVHTAVVTEQKHPTKSDLMVVKIAGQLDETNLPELAKVLDKYIFDTEVFFVLLDLATLEFLNSKVIGYLADYHGKLNEVNKKILMAGAPDNVMDILELVGMTTLVPCYNSTEDAVNALS